MIWGAIWSGISRPGGSFLRPGSRNLLGGTPWSDFGLPWGDFRPFLDGFGSHFAPNFNDIWKHVSTDLIVFLFVLRDAS